MVIRETKRLILREFVPEDIDALYKLYEDAEHCRYIDGLSASKGEEKEKLESYIQYVYGFYGFGLWAVIEKESGMLIGRCGLQVEDIGGEGMLEIGYMIGRPWLRKGYGLESVRAVLCYAYEETEETKVAARIDENNAASQALAVRAGFKKQKTISGHGRRTDLFIYSLPKRPWETE